MVVHWEILEDYKGKFKASIFSNFIDEAEKCLQHIRKLASLLITSTDQKWLMEVSFYTAALELYRYENCPLDSKYKRNPPDYGSLVSQFSKIESHLDLRAKIF